MLCIMRRTQLYLDQDIWTVLRMRSRQTGVSISELVRQAIREQYMSQKIRRQQAMQALVGIWKDRTDLPPTDRYLRQLRKGNRIKRLAS